MIRKLVFVAWTGSVTCLMMVISAALGADAIPSRPGSQPPILFPHPQKMVVNAQAVEMGPVSVVTPAGEERLKSAAEGWAATMATAQGNRVRVVFAQGDAGTSHDLGEQGYTLAVRTEASQTLVDVLAASERGRFHGLQTLKQLVEEGKLHVVHIEDQPTLSRRGVPAGGWWWRNRARMIPKYASLKFNYIYAGGEMLDGKFGGPAMKSVWRQPFSDSEKQQLKECLELARANFIDISVQMCPRGEPPVVYCSDHDIDLNVAKLAAIYDLGYRKFGINFDDLQNIGQNKIITEADKAKFGDDLGEAHRYFVEQVYMRLKKDHPDIEFSFCPLYYSGFKHMNEKGKAYLLSAGKLPKEIQLVTCPESEEETAMVTQWTHRPQMIWDNEIADRGGTFVGPLQRTAKYTDRDVIGYLTLLSDGDPFEIGYRSMADYMWSPERYDPRVAEETTLVKALGSAQAAAAVRSYRDATARLDAMRYPLLDKDARYAAMKADLDLVRQATDTMEKVVPENAATEAKRQTASLADMVETLEQRMDRQPFPVRVPRVSPGSIAIKSDVASPSAEWSRAAVLSDFISLRADKSAAAQTSAQLLHDGENLLVRLVCQEPNPSGIVAKHRSADEPVYDDDCVELFFITRPDTNDFRQTVVNTLGTLYGGVKSDAVVKVGPDQWVAEFSIPMKALGASEVKPGDVWRFNIARSRYQVKGDAHSSWAPLFARTFGVPSKFWPMVLE